ncbi:MAG: RNHCP domain-containing protein [Oscillospiraceae bacterium]
MNRSNKHTPRAFENDASSEPFTCKACGTLVTPDGAGSRHRNHCPVCLSSVHLDDEPGDRMAECGAIMDAVGIWVRASGEWALIHRCRRCGVMHSNRVAADDSPLKLISIAAKPLASPPFPIELITRMDLPEKTE